VELVNSNAAIFNQNNPDVNLSVTDLGGQYTTALYTRYQAGNPPDMHYSTPDVAYFLQYKKWLADVEDIAPQSRKYLDDMYPGVRQFHINPFTKKLHGLCYWLGPIVLAYNASHIKQAGFDAPPKTYDELAAQMLAIKKKGICPFPTGATWSWGFAYLWYNIMIGNVDPTTTAHYLFDENYNPIFNDKGTPFFDAVKWFLDRVYVDKTISPGIREYDESGITTALGSGTVSFALAFADYDVAAANASTMKQTGNIRIAMNPGSGYATFHAATYNISKHCTDKGKSAQDAVWKAMEFAGGKTTNAKSDYDNGQFFVCKKLLDTYGVTSAYKAVNEDPSSIATMEKLGINTDVLMQQYQKLSSITYWDPAQTPWWGDWFSSPSSEAGGRVMPKFEAMMTKATKPSDNDILAFLNDIANDWNTSKKAAGW
jgi:multiple sugar transport system substrate-binding protein